MFRRAAALLLTWFFAALSPGLAGAQESLSSGGSTCSANDRVHVEVQGVLLSAPRSDSIFVTRNDGKTRFGLGHPAPGYDCKTSLVSGIAGLSLGNMWIGETGLRTMATREKYLRLRRTVEALKYNNKTITSELRDGTKRLTLPNFPYEYILLPIDKAPTLDDAPVIFACGPIGEGILAIVPPSCEVSYIHPSGPRIVYDLDRKTVKDDDFLAADREKRRVLEDMISRAKEPPTKKK